MIGEVASSFSTAPVKRHLWIEYADSGQEAYLDESHPGACQPSKTLRVF
jgi:hypothetical protein